MYTHMTVHQHTSMHNTIQNIEFKVYMQYK